MKKDTIITVNGQKYDTVTGLPVNDTAPVTPAVKPAAVPPPMPRATTNARSLHAAPGRTKTLRRTTKKSPAATQNSLKTSAKKQQALSSTPAARQRQTSPQSPGGNVSDIISSRKSRPSHTQPHPATNPQVKKFAATPSKKPSASPDITPRNHPHAAAAAQKKTTVQRHAAARAPSSAPSAPHTTKAIKDAEIKKALVAAKPPSQSPTPPRPPRRHRRTVRWSALIIFILLVVGAIVIMYLPTISVRIASTQSGVQAEVPHFMPDGYRLRLPAAAENNRVTLTFVSNQNDATFTLTQEKSSWDSQAVRASVEQQSGGQFLTTNDRGLTIYTYNGNAAWVNKGILYQIKGDSQLSNDTILRIASSL